jgi:nicotinate-nucleotide pyrophosphorylase (carboxylating)
MISELLLGDLVRASLQEDVGSGDVTTSPLIPASQRARGVALANGPGIIAGVSVAAAAFRTMDPLCHIEIQKGDGSRVEVGDRIMTVEGLAAPMLMAERVALNFLQRMSGIATETAKYVEAARGLRVRIVDTRKTTPGLRAIEKYAVRMGGGFNHRFGLYDAVLIKDNHLSLLRARGIGLSEAVRLIKAKAPHTMRVEVEVTRPDQVEDVIGAGADAILLDNMGVDDIGSAVKIARGRVLLEASGGITLGNVREVAGAGVDLISIGAITHSAPSLDISLEIERIEG